MSPSLACGPNERRIAASVCHAGKPVARSTKLGSDFAAEQALPV